jgi:hypothetical protein
MGSGTYESIKSAIGTDIHLGNAVNKSFDTILYGVFIDLYNKN